MRHKIFAIAYMLLMCAGASANAEGLGKFLPKPPAHMIYGSEYNPNKLGYFAPAASENAVRQEELYQVDSLGYDPQLVARSRAMFPFVSQNARRLEWLQNQENIEKDRQQGNSYSIHIK